MNRIIQIFSLALIFSLVSGCNVETRSGGNVLRISFSPGSYEHGSWAAATAMVFDFHNIYVSQEDIVDFRYYYYGNGDVEISDISWLLWGLGGIDSRLTGTLSFQEIRFYIDSGNPILLQYGDYYNGHYSLLHGYDDRGHIYIHDPDYGTRVIHYDDLYFRKINGLEYYWESSLIILN
jgi:hypothetical protein